MIETGAFHKFLDDPCAFCAKTPIFRSKNDRLRKKGGIPNLLTSHDHHPGPLHRNSSLALTAISINIVKLVAQ